MRLSFPTPFMLILLCKDINAYISIAVQLFLSKKSVCIAFDNGKKLLWCQNATLSRPSIYGCCAQAQVVANFASFPILVPWNL